jgi:hypothetical protein
VADVTITTMVTVTVNFLDRSSVAFYVNKAMSAVQAALVNAGFPATVKPATAVIVAIPTAIPTASAATANSNTGR